MSVSCADGLRKMLRPQLEGPSPCVSLRAMMVQYLLIRVHRDLVQHSYHRQHESAMLHFPLRALETHFGSEEVPASIRPGLCSRGQASAYPLLLCKGHLACLWRDLAGPATGAAEWEEKTVSLAGLGLSPVLTPQQQCDLRQVIERSGPAFAYLQYGDNNYLPDQRSEVGFSDVPITYLLPGSS